MVFTLSFFGPSYRAVRYSLSSLCPTRLAARCPTRLAARCQSFTAPSPSDTSPPKGLLVAFAWQRACGTLVALQAVGLEPSRTRADSVGECGYGWIGTRSKNGGGQSLRRVRLRTSRTR
jgi:hypothetical protein